MAAKTSGSVQQTSEPRVGLSIQVPMSLAVRLRELARTESNGISAVCRRILADGLRRAQGDGPKAA